MAFILTSNPVTQELRGGISYHSHHVTQQVIPNRIVEGKNVAELESALDAYILECRAQYRGLFSASVIAQRSQRKPRGFDAAKSSGILSKISKPE